MLYVDAVDHATLNDLIRHRADICVSVYIDTTPLTQEALGDRIKLKNLAREAMEQLAAADADKRRVHALSENIDDLIDDEEFWRFQANGLAVLTTPDSIRSFRLASRVTPMVAVSDRFHLGPLFRTTSVGQSAYVLALSEGSVRLVVVSPEAPASEVRVPSLPKDAASAVHRASTQDRSPSGRLHGSEGQKVLLRQYARIVDNALREVLRGQQTPLVLAADTMIASLFRSVCSYPHLTAEGIERSPERMSPAELADDVRPILDRLHAARIRDWHRTFAARALAGRAASDLDRIARAATMGAVESLLIDIDTVVEGTVDDETGAITRAGAADARSYDIIDELAGRVMQSGGTVYGVRAPDLPAPGPIAAIMRFAV
jgi:hypothetical protein